MAAGKGTALKLKLWFIQAGSTRHPEAVVLPGRSWKPIVFPASVAVIEHPLHGVILFDTGYSCRFFEVTRRFPERFYALITPVSVAPEQTAAAQLEAQGIAPEQVAYVVLSHFHADHVAGVADFPQATMVYQEEGWNELMQKSRFFQVKAGFLAGLLPEGLRRKNRPVTLEELDTGATGIPIFERGLDLFGDGTLFLVSLPGHAEGHMGLLVKEASQTTFLIADAAWQSESIMRNLLPLPFAQWIFRDRSLYADTLSKLHELAKLRPDIRLVPCHCQAKLADLNHQRERTS